MSWTRPEIVAKVSNKSGDNPFLLFTGKEQTKTQNTKDARKWKIFTYFWIVYILHFLQGRLTSFGSHGKGPRVPYGKPTMQHWSTDIPYQSLVEVYSNNYSSLSFYTVCSCKVIMQVQHTQVHGHDVRVLGCASAARPEGRKISSQNSWLRWTVLHLLNFPDPPHGVSSWSPWDQPHASFVISCHLPSAIHCQQVLPTATHRLVSQTLYLCSVTDMPLNIC